MDAISSIYSGFRVTDPENIFKYAAVTFIALAIFRKMVIGINILVGLMVLSVVYLMISSNNYITKKEDNIIDEIKKESIRPASRKAHKYKDISDYLFSIADLYYINQGVFEDIVDDIDDFMLLYEESIIQPKLSGRNYYIAKQKLRDSVNATHSLIHSVPSTPDGIYEKKIKDAIKLQTHILNRYLSTIYDANMIYNKAFGMNVNSVLVNNGPEAHNYDYHSSSKYTWNLFQ